MPTQPPPKYADIFNYLTPGMMNAGASGLDWATPTQDHIIGYHTEQQGGGEGGTVDVQVPDYATGYTIDQSKVPDQYKGMVTGYRAADNGQGGQVNYDFSKIPGGGQTKFGSIDQMTSLGTGAQPQTHFNAGKGGEGGEWYVGDHSKIAYDPNYGWITPSTNTLNVDPKEQGFMKQVNQYAPLIASAAVSAFGQPELALAFQGMNAVGQGSESGNWKKALLNFAPSLLTYGMGPSGFNIGGGGFGMPSGLSDLLKYANYAKSGYGAYNALQHNNPVGAGLTLGGMAQQFGGQGMSLGQLAQQFGGG